MEKSKLLGVVIAVTLAGSLNAIVGAQQGGVNISVLPALASPPNDPDGYLKSDQLGQKQLEGSVAFSTRNVLHGLAAFIDYRAVSIAEQGLGEQARASSNPIQWLARMFFRRPGPPAVKAAAPEAWVGTSFTYDGISWSGGFVPGGPFDNSSASLTSPVRQKGYLAATDPWVVSAPCGRFHIVYVPFTRFQGSSVAVATYEDRNNLDGQHTIQYVGTVLVDTANNATNGPFHDLPHAVVDPTRSTTGNPCAYNLYVSWTTFSGNETTRINFARSLNGGQTFTKTFVSTPAKTNQRAVIAVDPRPGTPKTTGGGTVFVAFRSFDATMNAMWVSRSVDFGDKFDGAVQLNGTTLYPFDQNTQSSDQVLPSFVTFRTNAYITLQAVPTANGRTLYAAWSERVNLAACPGGANCGRPDPTGEPRIVMMKSVDDKAHVWTDLSTPAAVGQRAAIDFFCRDTAQSDPSCQVTQSPGATGYLPDARPSGAQIQPHFTFADGRFGLFYLESRAALVAPGVIAGLDPAAPNGDWRGPQIDARFALLDPSSGALLGTTQISRYPVKADAKAADVDTFDGIAEVVIGSPSKQVNYKATFPNSGGGKSPFYGDFTGVTPVVQYVIDKITGRWRWAIQPGDQPFRGFHALWPDSRHLSPPSGTPQQQVAKSPSFNAANATWPSCGDVNGSRNHDMMTALVNANVLVNAPTTSKFGTIQRAFPITVTNGAATSKCFRLTLSNNAIGSFDQDVPSRDQLDIQILPYSSATPVVYIEVTAVSTPETVSVAETQCPAGAGSPLVPGGQTGSVTLNLDPSNPGYQTAPGNTEKHNPLVTAPLVTAPLVTANAPLVTAPMVTAPLVTASGAVAPLVTAPLVTAPLVTAAPPPDWNGKVTDFTWTVTGEDTTVNSGLYTQVFVDNATVPQNQYGLELRIYRRTSYTMVVRDPQTGNCVTVSVPQEQLISSIPNPLVTAPLVTAPFAPENAQNPLVTAATFAASPPDPGSGASANSSASVAAAAAPASDGTLRGKRDNQVFVTLLAYWRGGTNSPPPGVTCSGSTCTSASPPGIAVVAESKNIVDGVEDPSPIITFLAPDLLVSGPPSLTPTTSLPGGQVTLSWTVKNDGNANAAAADGAITHTYVFSNNSTLGDGDDVVIGTDTSATLAPGATQAFSKLLTIPDSASPGSPRYIFIKVDSDAEISERFDTNNTASTTLTIVDGLAVLNTDYVSAGLGGLRVNGFAAGDGAGTITLTGVSGTVKKALLYWNGPTNSTDPNINATVSFNAASVTGVNIGTASCNCWEASGFTNSYSYRADVTSLVAGNGNYAVSNLVKTVGVDQADINGVSLLVFFDDGNASNNINVYLRDGNDSNAISPVIPDTWNTTVNAVNVPAGYVVTLQLHVTDGQPSSEGPFSVNADTNYQFAAFGPNFEGASVPVDNTAAFPGWDIKAYNINPAVTSSGLKSVTVTTPDFGADCVGLVVAVVIVSPPGPPIGNH